MVTTVRGWLVTCPIPRCRYVTDPLVTRFYVAFGYATVALILPFVVDCPTFTLLICLRFTLLVGYVVVVTLRLFPVTRVVADTRTPLRLPCDHVCLLLTVVTFPVTVTCYVVRGTLATFGGDALLRCALLLRCCCSCYV